MDVPVNYWAVLISAVAAMVVGFLWYGVLFKAKWMELMGYTRENMGQMKMTANKAYLLQFIASLAMACVLSKIITVKSAYVEMGGLGVALKAAFVVWLGFVAPITLGSVLWENRPWKLWFINSSSYLVTLLVMGVILGFWR